MKNLKIILIIVAVIAFLVWYYYSSFKEMKTWTPEQIDTYQEGADQRGSGPYRY